MLRLSSSAGLQNDDVITTVTLPDVASDNAPKTSVLELHCVTEKETEEGHKLIETFSSRQIDSLGYDESKGLVKDTRVQETTEKVIRSGPGGEEEGEEEADGGKVSTEKVIHETHRISDATGAILAEVVTKKEEYEELTTSIVQDNGMDISNTSNGPVKVLNQARKRRSSSVSSRTGTGKLDEGLLARLAAASAAAEAANDAEKKMQSLNRTDVSVNATVLTSDDGTVCDLRSAVSADQSINNQSTISTNNSGDKKCDYKVSFNSDTSDSEDDEQNSKSTAQNKANGGRSQTQTTRGRSRITVANEKENRNTNNNIDNKLPNNNDEENQSLLPNNAINTAQQNKIVDAQHLNGSVSSNEASHNGDIIIQNGFNENKSADINYMPTNEETKKFTYCNGQQQVAGNDNVNSTTTAQNGTALHSSASGFQPSALAPIPGGYSEFTPAQMSDGGHVEQHADDVARTPSQHRQHKDEEEGPLAASRPGQVQGRGQVTSAAVAEALRAAQAALAIARDAKQAADVAAITSNRSSSSFSRRLSLQYSNSPAASFQASADEAAATAAAATARARQLIRESTAALSASRLPSLLSPQYTAMSSAASAQQMDATGEGQSQLQGRRGVTFDPARGGWVAQKRYRTSSMTSSITSDNCGDVTDDLKTFTGNCDLNAEGEDTSSVPNTNPLATDGKPNGHNTSNNGNFSENGDESVSAYTEEGSSNGNYGNIETSTNLRDVTRRTVTSSSSRVSFASSSNGGQGYLDDLGDLGSSDVTINRIGSSSNSALSAGSSGWRSASLINGLSGPYSTLSSSSNRRIPYTGVNSSSSSSSRRYNDDIDDLIARTLSMTSQSTSSRKTPSPADVIRRVTSDLRQRHKLDCGGRNLDLELDVDRYLSSLDGVVGQSEGRLPVRNRYLPGNSGYSYSGGLGLGLRRTTSYDAGYSTSGHVTGNGSGIGITADGLDYSDLLPNGRRASESRGGLGARREVVGASRVIDSLEDDNSDGLAAVRRARRRREARDVNVTYFGPDDAINIDDYVTAAANQEEGEEGREALPDEEFVPQKRAETDDIVKEKTVDARIIVNQQASVIEKLKNTSKSLDELDDDLRELQQQFIGCQIRHAAVCQDDDVSARGNRGNTSYDVTSLLATGSRKSSAPAVGRKLRASSVDVDSSHANEYTKVPYAASLRISSTSVVNDADAVGGDEETDSFYGKTTLSRYSSLRRQPLMTSYSIGGLGGAVSTPALDAIGKIKYLSAAATSANPTGNLLTTSGRVDLQNGGGSDENNFRSKFLDKVREKKASGETVLPSTGGGEKKPSRFLKK